MSKGKYIEARDAKEAAYKKKRTYKPLSCKSQRRNNHVPIYRSPPNQWIASRLLDHQQKTMIYERILNLLYRQNLIPSTMSFLTFQTLQKMQKGLTPKFFCAPLQLKACSNSKECPELKRDYPSHPHKREEHLSKHLWALSLHNEAVDRSL